MMNHHQNIHTPENEDPREILSKLRTALHDLRTPLSILELCAEMISDTEDTEKNFTAQKILRANRHASILSRDMSSVLKIAEGAYISNPTPTSLRGVIEESLKQSAIRVQLDLLSIRWEFPETLPDPELDREVAVSFFANCICFGAKHFRTPTVSSIHAFKKENDTVHIEIRISSEESDVNQKISIEQSLLNSWEAYAIQKFAKVLQTSFSAQYTAGQIKITVTLPL